MPRTGIGCRGRAGQAFAEGQEVVGCARPARAPKSPGKKAGAYFGGKNGYRDGRRQGLEDGREYANRQLEQQMSGFGKAL